jgi:hypothetical protein
MNGCCPERDPTCLRTPERTSQPRSGDIFVEQRCSMNSSSGGAAHSVAHKWAAPPHKVDSARPYLRQIVRLRGDGIVVAMIVSQTNVISGKRQHEKESDW